MPGGHQGLHHGKRLIYQGRARPFNCSTTMQQTGVAVGPIHSFPFPSIITIFFHLIGAGLSLHFNRTYIILGCTEQLQAHLHIGDKKTNGPIAFWVWSTESKFGLNAQAHAKAYSERSNTYDQVQVQCEGSTPVLQQMASHNASSV